MADRNQGGEKTEQPTQKRLEDARRKGDVAKSKDVTGTAVLFVWLLVLVFGAGFAGSRIMGLFEAAFAMIARGEPFQAAVGAFGWSALMALLLLTAVALIPAALTGVLAEFLQTGGVFTVKKLTPSFDKMNPAEGIKRMFSADNLVELAKTLAKASLILCVCWLVLRGSLANIIDKSGPILAPEPGEDGRAAAAAVLGSNGEMLRTILLWTFGIFLLVAVIDMAWQRHSYIKKLMMSVRDIRDEHKENEGDPMIKSQRRALHEEWSSQNAVGAARGASVLVINPTHIAIAIDYDPQSCPVPIMTGKGEGPLAQAMRAAAEEAEVPIVRYVSVARRLYEDGVVDDVIPRAMFDAIAQIVLWSQKVRAEGGPKVTEMDGETHSRTAGVQ